MRSIASLLLLSTLLATVAGNGSSTSLRRAQVAEIVGGTVADHNDYPYFVSLTQGCGGTLVHEDIVLSAAHCDTFSFSALVGPNRVSARVSRTVVHQGYNSNTFKNDFMIIKLDSSFPNIKLPNINSSGGAPSGTQDIVVMGYGATSEGGSGSNSFREATLQHVPHSQCNGASSYNGEVDEATMFCAGVDGGGRDSCQGDSGGPLVMGNNLVGVVSWGYGCAREEYPGVNARVSSAASWIDNWICCLSSNPPSGCVCDDSQGNSGSGSDGSGGSIGLCYSGDNHIQVQNKGDVLMSELQVGDRVLTSNDGAFNKRYEPVYAFGHRQEALKTSFIKLWVDSGEWIEMTGAHLIHVKEKVHPVRADSVQVGDSLVGQIGESLQVTKIQAVTKNGIYAPLTTSGNIVVNGMMASSYVSLQENADEYVQLRSTNIMVSQADISHWWMSPLRMLCSASNQSLEICNTVDEDGLSPWVALGFRYVEWGENQNVFLQIIVLAATLLGLTLVNAVEAAINLPMIILAFVSLAVLLNRNTVEVRATIRFGSPSKQKVV